MSSSSEPAAAAAASSSTAAITTTRPSRSLRKRQPTKLADDYDFDLESLLKEHEKKGEEYRARKKQKQPYKTEEDEKYADAFEGCECPPLDTLPALCIERIFAMVSSSIKRWWVPIAIYCSGGAILHCTFSTHLKFFVPPPSIHQSPHTVGQSSRFIQPCLHKQIPNVPRHSRGRHPISRLQQYTQTWQGESKNHVQHYGIH